MFQKILVLEDIDSILLGITALLEKNFNAEIHNSKYCDEAYIKIKKSIKEKEPFDLIITDLSFKEDLSRENIIKSGEELIERLHSEDISPKIIVYSIEDKPYQMQSFLANDMIQGFVIKGRDSNTELVDAIIAASKNDIYISAPLSAMLKQQDLFQIDKYDVEILKLLSIGNTQEDISKAFKKNKYPTASTSSIEKKINRLKYMLKAQTSIHLIAIAKDMRII